MDHFLPKSFFPYLSMYWENLICACSICNGNQVKHHRWVIPILHPYFDNIQHSIRFNFDANNRRIGLVALKNVSSIPKSKLRGNNFIKLLKLNTRYIRLWDYVDKEYNELKLAVEAHYHRNKHEEKIYQ